MVEHGDMTTVWSIGDFEQVTDGVFVARCEPAGVNVGLVVGEEEALLVDAGAYPEQGAALMASAEALAGVPVHHVVVTHAHWDHWFGATGLAAHVKEPGAPLPRGEEKHLRHTIVGHAKLWSDDAADPAELERLGVPAPPAPRLAVSDRIDLDLGDVPVFVRHLGAAHTQSDLVVYLPTHGVLFAGDLVEESGDPQTDETSDPAGWVEALDRLVRIVEHGEASYPQRGGAHGGTLIVPGHGKSVDLDFVRAQREWIARNLVTSERDS